MSLDNNITLIAGATASGKSALACSVAREKNGRIINADALQIYCDLPILTAQPSMQDQTEIPHRLYGILPPDTMCSVQDWVARAVHEIKDTWAAGQHPVVVGGTGMYLNALMLGLSPIPNVPDDIRDVARARQAEMGNPAFHAELARLDAVMAARLNPNDTQRLIRAYEVVVATGKSLADWQGRPRVQPLPEAVFDRILVDGSRDVLRARAHTRLGQMLDGGVLDEISAFQKRIDAGDVSIDAPPLRALGYYPFLSHIRGEIARDAAVKAAHIETAQYIKRQQTWIRHQMTFDRVVEVG